MLHIYNGVEGYGECGQWRYLYALSCVNYPLIDSGIPPNFPGFGRLIRLAFSPCPQYPLAKPRTTVLSYSFVFFIIIDYVT